MVDVETAGTVRKGLPAIPAGTSVAVVDFAAGVGLMLNPALAGIALRATSLVDLGVLTVVVPLVLLLGLRVIAVVHSGRALLRRLATRARLVSLAVALAVFIEVVCSVLTSAFAHAFFAVRAIAAAAGSLPVVIGKRLRLTTSVARSHPGTFYPFHKEVLVATLALTFAAGSETGAALRKLAKEIEVIAALLPDRMPTGASTVLTVDNAPGSASNAVGVQLTAGPVTSTQRVVKA